MENSIETIWKKGFLDGHELIAPKVNDLYNRKSEHIIARFHRMFKTNLWAILIGASVVLAVSIFIGALIAGTIIFGLLLWQIYVGYQALKKLDELDQTQTSYQYLLSFRKWINTTLWQYTTINRFFYPLFSAAFALGLWYSDPMTELRNELIQRSSNIMGIPLFLAIPMILVVLLSGVFSKKIYEIDVKSIYGGILKKLNEMIDDMETLRA